MIYIRNPKIAVVLLINIMVAVQTLKGICTRRKSPSGLIALLEIRKKFHVKYGVPCTP